MIKSELKIGQKFYKNLPVKSIDEENHIVEAVFSTDDKDRHGEIVDQSGWDLKEFEKNPVVLFSHDHWQPAIGKVIELGIVDGKLQGKIKFAVEEYDFAKTIFNLFKGGFMRGFSVGFEALEIEEQDGQVILKENRLLEISVVNIPANAMALAKSKGIDIAPLEREINKSAILDKGIIKKSIEVLDEAKNQLQELLRSDINGGSKEVKKGRKPLAVKGGKKKKIISAKKLNMVIRSLLKQKQKLIKY